MTREEAIIYLKSFKLCTPYTMDAQGVFYRAVEIAIEALNQEPRWISVKEKLPEERLGVLVWCPTRKNIYCACYEEKQWWIFGAYREKVTEEIVAWRPLPTKPYREVK